MHGTETTVARTPNVLLTSALLRDLIGDALEHLARKWVHKPDHARNLGGARALACVLMHKTVFDDYVECEWFADDRIDAAAGDVLNEAG